MLCSGNWRDIMKTSPSILYLPRHKLSLKIMLAWCVIINTLSSGESAIYIIIICKMLPMFENNPDMILIRQTFLLEWRNTLATACFASAKCSIENRCGCESPIVLTRGDLIKMVEILQTTFSNAFLNGNISLLNIILLNCNLGFYLTTIQHYFRELSKPMVTIPYISCIVPHKSVIFAKRNQSAAILFNIWIIQMVCSRRIWW